MALSSFLFPELAPVQIRLSTPDLDGVGINGDFRTHSSLHIELVFASTAGTKGLSLTSPMKLIASLVG